jgi:hypothetical protein
MAAECASSNVCGSSGGGLPVGCRIGSPTERRAPASAVGAVTSSASRAIAIAAPSSMREPFVSSTIDGVDSSPPSSASLKPPTDAFGRCLPCAGFPSSAFLQMCLFGEQYHMRTIVLPPGPRCIRCGHMPCPFCGGWCDELIENELCCDGECAYEGDALADWLAEWSLPDEIEFGTAVALAEGPYCPASFR